MEICAAIRPIPPSTVILYCQRLHFPGTMPTTKIWNIFVQFPVSRHLKSSGSSKRLPAPPPTSSPPVDCHTRRRLESTNYSLPTILHASEIRESIIPFWDTGLRIVQQNPSFLRISSIYKTRPGPEYRGSNSNIKYTLLGLPYRDNENATELATGL